MNAPLPTLALENLEIDSQGDPTWYRDAVIYQVSVKSFFDSNDDGIGDFKGLTSRLDYVKNLGVTTLWLMPFFPSPLKDDGYDIADYENVHPAYGTLQDFRDLMAEAHKRELRVIIELVINHTSSEHPWFQRARQAPPGSPERDFYVWSDTEERYQGTRIIFTDTERSNWSWDPVAKAFFWHRFFSHQPDLNFDNPAVLEAVFRVMRFWLDMGVDGFRLDAVPYLIERDGTSNENLPETHAVIKKLRAAIDANYRDRFLLAEANMWPEDVREYFGDGDECHMAYHFPLMPRMYMAIAQEDRDPIVEILQQTPDIPEGCQWAIFLRNHDELTLEMVTSRERDYMYTTYATDVQARINLGIRRRLAPLMDNDMARIQLMNGLLLSMPGTPIIYYGDELGMGDNVFAGDRNGVRTPMQWTPDRNAGFSRADPQRLYLPPIMDAIYGYEAVNVETQLRDKSSLLHWTRRMLAVRKTSRAFGRGRRTFLKPGNRRVLAYVSEFGEDTILCVFNLSRAAQPVELNLAAWKGRIPVEMMGRTSFPPIGELPYLLTLPSHSFYWFRLAEDAPVPAWHQDGMVPDERPTLVLSSGWSSLFREQVSPWRLAQADRLRRQFDTEAMPQYIEAQRWYAHKDTPLAGVRLLDDTVWTVGDHSWLLPLVALDGPKDALPCFMPLALAWEDRDDERMKRLEPAAVAKVREHANVGLMGDAFFDEPFCQAMVQAILEGAEVPMRHGRLRFTPTALARELDVPVLSALPAARPAPTSSNTVLAIGESLFLKAYRQLRPGINPELEMGRHLAEVAGFTHGVPLAGVVDYVDAQGEVTTLALLQAYVPNQLDGWSYTLSYLERFLADLRDDADMPPPADPHASFSALMRTLGCRTASLHNALRRAGGNPDFEPVPFDAEAAHAVRARVRKDAEATLDRLAQALPNLPQAAREDVQRLVARRAQVLALVDAIPLSGHAGWCTRFHGDFHLGQVLVARNDFLIIDFEGEPSRPLEERRAKESPLRDVAGMLRSFNYARSAALRHAAQNAEELARLDAALHRWEQEVRAAFLAGYTEALAPQAGPVDRSLLSLFELEKAFYELRYEMGNRLDWLPVPLRGILALLDAAAPGSVGA